MRKMVKLVVLVLAVVAAVSLFVNVNNGNISLDFKNSGSPEWITDDTTLDFKNSGSPEWITDDTTLDFKNSGSPEWITDDTTLDFKNSGSPEWITDDSVVLYTGITVALPTSIIKQIVSNDNGFKNSGLPETIELSIMAL